MPLHLSVPQPYPETKPATEFIAGQLVQKMSPRGLHARVQGAIVSALRAWANELGRGRVGTEWDFDLTPPGEHVNRLVPDVAFLSYSRVGYEDDASAEIPSVAPDVAVEILSPGQSVGMLAEKTRIYLAADCELVVVIDPREEYALLYDAERAHRVDRDEMLTHASLPGFHVTLSSLFEKPKPKPQA